MPTIYIARHGQDEDNVNGILNGHRDMPLTLLGLEQAYNLASHIRKNVISFDKIYSSPLLRSFTTAKIVAEVLELPSPEKLDLLIERDFGIMTGRLRSEIVAMCAPDIIKTDTVTYFLSPEGCETFPQLLERARAIISYVEENHGEGESVLLVCHGDVGKMIYAAYYKLDWERALKEFHFGNSELLLLSKNTKPEDAHVFKQNKL